MQGRTHAYLELASIAAVGATLLDPRPALVFTADGAGILFGNAAAVHVFGAQSVHDLLRKTISPLNPLKAQLARLARLLPSDTSRVEMLRIGQGTGLVMQPATCRRLNFADGTRAVLAILGGAVPAASLTARAETLTDALAGSGCMAAVLGDEGRVLAGSGDFEALAAIETEIDDLAGAAEASDGRAVKRAIPLGSGSVAAGATGFAADGRRLVLLIVETRETALAAPVAEAEPAPASAEARQEPPSAPTVEPPAPAPPEAPAEAPAPRARTTRFLWETDAAGVFTFVSPELAAAVGNDEAAITGRRLADVAEAFAVDAGGVTRATPDGHAIATSLRWPAGQDETLLIDLVGNPIPSRQGMRGFGTVHLDRRQTDDRPRRLPPASLANEPAPSVREDSLPPAAVSPEPPPTLDMPPPEIPAPNGPPPPAADEVSDLDRVARVSIEGGQRSAAPQAAPKRPFETAGNVVRLPATARALQRDALSGSERDAFQRIAEALATTGAAAPDLTPVEEDASEPPAEQPKRPADIEIDARLLDRLPLAITLFRDGRTLLANRPLLDLLGFASHDDFLAAGGAEAIFPEHGPAGSITEPGNPVAARRADGETIPVKAWLHAVTYAGQTALMLSLLDLRGIAHADEDEQSAALAASQARADELAAILDTATDGVLVVEKRGRIVSMNRAAEALFGIASADYFGRYFTDLFADESQKPALDYLDGLASNGVASVLNDGREVIGRVPQGGLIPLFMTMGRIGTSDKFCAVLRDITHWKNVESELVAARRAAEAANLQKSEFLAKISHEIRTPLNAIIGFSEVMMSERFGPIGNSRYRDYLHDIHVSGAHLMSLINDLLDLSKVEAGKLDLNFAAVALNAAVQECVALMQPQANRERIIIRTSLTADLPNVVADQRALRQILLNLISNAVKFTRAGGQVIVSTALEETGEVVLRIRDTGIGMSEKDLETALKPFRQVATAKKDRDNGTGLGLPLTKALVEANRATFAIESAVDEGTLVKITFPTTRVLAS